MHIQSLVLVVVCLCLHGAQAGWRNWVGLSTQDQANYDHAVAGAKADVKEMGQALVFAVKQVAGTFTPAQADLNKMRDEMVRHEVIAVYPGIGQYPAAVNIMKDTWKVIISQTCHLTIKYVSKPPPADLCSIVIQA